MKSFKKYIIALVFLLMMPSTVFASSNDVYNAVDDQSPITEISFNDALIYVTINGESDKALETTLMFANYTNNTISMVNPNSDAEKIFQEQKKLGIDFNTVSDDLGLENNPNSYTVIEKIQSLTPGIYTMLNPQGQLVFKISQAELVEDKEAIQIKLFNNILISLGREDDQTLSYDGFYLIRE